MSSEESEQRALQDHSQAEINRLHAAGMCYLNGHDTERTVEIGDELHLLCEGCDPEVA